LFLFSDGRQKVMDNQSMTVIDLAELPRDVQADIQTKMVEADAAKSAEALKVPVEEAKPAEVKPADTKPAEPVPVETKPAEPVDTKPVPTEETSAESKPVEVKPVEPVEVKPVETKTVEPTEIKRVEPRLEIDREPTLAQLSQTGGVTSAGGSTQTGPTTQTGGSTQVGGSTQIGGSQVQTGTSAPGGATGTVGTQGAGTDTVAGDIVTVTGGASNDTLAKGTTVTTGTDTLTGGAGNDTLKPGGLTQEQVQTIVTNALLANPGLTESDVKRIVGEAISKIPGGITATDVTNAVNSAISNLPKAPTTQDITNAVNNATTNFVKQSDLDTAIGNIKFPSSLSSDDVKDIVRTVMSENPGLSPTDVTNAINTALSTLPAAASPSDVNRAITSTVGSPSVADNPNTPENEAKPATGIYSVIESYQAAAEKETGELKKEIGDLTKAQKEAQELEEEQRKAAEEQNRMRLSLNQGTAILGGGLGALAGMASQAAPIAALPLLKGLTTGEATKEEFVSPLAAFQKQIGLIPEQKPEEQDKTMPYFSYGQPSDVASVLGLQDEEEQMAATGGLMTPLMASGGLPVVHYAGKPRIDFRKGAYVQGPGDGQSDDIPAMLADGEFVWPADVVSALGNGSNKAGAKKLYQAMHNIRSKHRSTNPKDLPPPALDSPLSYLSKAKR
jgi:hypothetical protein